MKLEEYLAQYIFIYLSAAFLFGRLNESVLSSNISNAVILQIDSDIYNVDDIRCQISIITSRAVFKTFVVMKEMLKFLYIGTYCIF